MRPLYIFDLDGTLALIDHRRHIVEDPSRDDSKWRRFHDACDRDEPNEPVIRVMESLRRFSDVWIFSGRSDEVAAKTISWLSKHTSFTRWELLRGNALTMRQAGDYTPDDRLKKQWLDAMLVDDRQRLVAAFDDRDRVVRMWRDNGVPCFQVARGDF